MTPTNNLDLQGIFSAFPLAELIVEICQARLDGSLRLTHEDQKVIVYFVGGEIVFAVSNARSSRIFDILLRENKIDKKTLSGIPNFTSDMELAQTLVEKKLFSKAGIDALFAAQIEEIIKSAFEWKTGAWIFSPLARIKEGINFKIDLHKMLAEYARKMPAEEICGRFKSVDESFIAAPMMSADIDLQPHEAFVLSRFADGQLTVEEVKMFGGLPESAMFQTLYVLWLGGFLTRRNWNAAFSENKIAEITSAHIKLKKESVQPRIAAVKAEVLPAKPTEEKPETPKTPIKEISLVDYLARIESSVTHYEVLDVAVKSASAEIKTAYFGLAKRFHPDHFHKETDASLHSRIQTAFSKIAQAYDILKTPETRETYDFRMRKELAEREKRQDLTVEENKEQEQTDLAAENFEQGFELLMEDNYAEAQQFLARAAFLAPNVARYRAFFGKLLSGDSSQRHKAEGELQTAVKLEPDNPTYRIMLVEFFIEYNLMKRAEGELNRIFKDFPDNREAQKLLDSLQNK